MGLLALGRPKVVPCTPLGCYKMLESILILEGKNVTILGRYPKTIKIKNIGTSCKVFPFVSWYDKDNASTLLAGDARSTIK